MISKFAILLIKFYQNFISGFFGPKCRFEPTCSTYSVECFQSFPPHRAMWYSVKRICKCHPFHPGGYDPVDDLRSNIKD